MAADFAALRREMVERQLAARGISDPRVLAAMAEVPREAFVPERLAEFAYEDTPLPIEEEQTISQPYIVAAMAEALELRPEDKVLEVGAGSGYAAAVLSRLARAVYAIERHAALARLAAERCARLGYTNVHILHGDGTLGWPEHAPYDAIAVAAGGPEVPPALLEQLAPGGRLVIPVGTDPSLQTLVRVRRSDGDFEREDLGAVRFVPLVGAQGWAEGEAGQPPAPARRAAPAAPAPRERPRRPAPAREVAPLVARVAEPFAEIDSADLGPLLERVGGAKVVLLGEATHGTSEFYRMRARITRELVARQGFTVVAVEADWPDAAQIDRWVRGGAPLADEPAFTRFPTWMWRNEEVVELARWLRAWNGGIEDPARRVSFHGLDLYSLYASIGAVVRYLEAVDPEAARVARLRYGCLTPWENDPALYGRAALMRTHQTCESEVVANLVDLLKRRLDYQARDPESFLDAAQNARIAATAERYYRVMYYGSRDSWNLRDQHMFETLQTVLAFRGPEAKAVVWEHNSHIGDATATEMGARGELNVGQLARERWRDGAYLVGFGTDHGTVAAASDWDGPMEIKSVRPARPDSYEGLCHESGVPSFLLALRQPADEEVRAELEPARLERAIGVIYRPETELQSHYFQAVLPWQFDEYVWFDETRAVTPLPGPEERGEPETYPFGL
ncbi:MAG TPA: protein-L-isoaspartate(D-aspartate) O-methyltransferase [Thermoanaerobaculia bacterium]